ncbi:Flagellar hook-associated protein 3 [Pseudidiomarina piscicola]|uniref:Flagellar hook-associated protein 3 n=1 Tax=Pseudidiomarina piscicola TaxID=2614830 RepID=A0A6S6WUU2_9GAMM|nr:flagellar hook-associated protein FlgL [Pseudidiomarina piscicola]CAB0151041.1 Flagellar hook-associated protein 3 [Pseudidiomarina piscicola]VZT40552.1 Flagellar hook-associated protein 3 [Pseudomonas aeruginosa]
MRISTMSMYNQSVASMNRQQSDFADISQKIASGKRVVSIADDPQAMTKAIDVRQSQALNEQFSAARVGVRNNLSQEESLLNSVTDTYSRAKTLLVQAASDSLSDLDRASVASELKGLYQSLEGLANTRDANGQYLFAGYADDTAPFAKDANGSLNYIGSTDVREQQVDSERRMAVGHSGDEIFAAVHPSASYGFQAAQDNQGSLKVGNLAIIDPNHVNFGQKYDISFETNAGQLQYRVNNGQAQDYASPMTLALDGVEVELTGTPTAGDSLSVGRGADLPTNIFKTMENVIAVLDKPAADDASKAQRANQIRSAMQQFDNGLDNVLTKRAELGARLNELDSLDVISGNQTLANAQTTSDLTDLNYVEASAEYSLRIVGLQAAQQTFASMKDMSLFKFL